MAAERDQMSALRRMRPSLTSTEYLIRQTTSDRMAYPLTQRGSLESTPEQTCSGPNREGANAPLVEGCNEVYNSLGRVPSIL